MKQAPGRARILPWLIVAAFFSATIPCLAVAAAKPAAKKPAAKAAKPAAKPASAKSGASSSGSSEAKSATPYEVPSPGGAEIPPGSASSGTSGSGSSAPATASTTSTTSETPSKPAESPPPEAAKEPSKVSPAPEAPKDPVASPEPSPPPPPEEPIVIPEPTPLLVANLGPSTYPGKQRGIHGGSLWLEPSFHGLQWPQMSKSGVGLSGMIWSDTGYMQIKRENRGFPDTATPFEQGRALVRVTPTYTDGRFFAQGQVELVGNLCQPASAVCSGAGTVDTDDAWVRFGVWNAWDVQVGRFRGWELYHTGMGLDLYTLERLGAQHLGFVMPTNPPDLNLTGLEALQAPDIYGVSYLYDRPNQGLGVGYVAFHAYPSNHFRFEMLGKLGVTDLVTGTSYYGGRPAIILDQGWMKLKVGAEYEKGVQTSPLKQDNASVKIEQTHWGAGAALQFVLAPFAELGGNFAYGSQETSAQDSMFAQTNSYKRASVGGFANVRLAAPWIFGAGVNFTWQNDKYYATGSESPDYAAHLQAFGALQYLVADQLFVKLVIAYARADFVTSNGDINVWSDSMVSGRVRLMYLY